MDFCEVTHREGKRLHVVVELKLKHPILFIPSASLIFGPGCLRCSWAAFMVHVAEAMLLVFNSCTT